MNCFVTGASGFIGANLVHELAARQHRVKALLRLGRDLRGLAGAEFERARGRPEAMPPGSPPPCAAANGAHVAASYHLWLRDYRPMRRQCRGHPHGHPGRRRLGCQRIVYTSTVGCLALPEPGAGPTRRLTKPRWRAKARLFNHYKKSKWQAEQVALRLARDGCPVVIVNSAPVGPRDVKPTPTGPVIVDFLNRQMPAYLDTGLNYVHVRDVAAGRILAAQRRHRLERYILGHADGNWTMRQAFAVLEEITGIHAPRLRIPHAVALGAAGISEALAHAPPPQSAARRGPDGPLQDVLQPGRHPRAGPAANAPAAGARRRRRVVRQNGYVTRGG